MKTYNPIKWSGLVSFTICASLLAVLPVRGQDPAAPGEIRAVVRISKELIQDVASRKEIVAALPLDARIVGFRCRGVIDGRGKLSIDVVSAEGDATCMVTGKGTAEVYVRGVLGPLVIEAPTGAVFTSQTLVRFDGRKFIVLETTPCVDVKVHLDNVHACLETRVGEAVGQVVRIPASILVPRAERQARPVGDAILKDFVDNLAGQIVEKLNRATAVEKSLDRILPKTADWVFHVSADSQFIQAAYGPPGSKAPKLPANPSGIKDVRMEMWLHTTTKEAQALAKLSKEPLAKPLIQQYLKATFPELAALAETRSVDSVGSWLVITVGAPKAE
jgi:hypothetical protein